MCSRQKKQPVENPWAGNVSGVSLERQGDPCGWETSRKPQSRRCGQRGSAARSCQPLTFTQSEVGKLWRVLSDVARLQKGDVYWKCTVCHLTRWGPYWDQWRGHRRDPGEGREVRVTSKAFGPSTWRGGTAVTGNEDHRGKAGLGIETGSEVLDMFSLGGILT